MSDDNRTRWGSVERRTFLKTTGATTVGVSGLAGCLGSLPGGGSKPGDQELREELGIPELDYLSDIENELNIITWSGYMPDGYVDQFKKAFGIDTVNVSFIGSNEELYNKLKAGGSGQFDFIVVTNGKGRVMVRQDMLTALNKEKIPNFDNLMPKFRNPEYDLGSDVHFVPWQWGTNGIGWSEEVLGSDANPTSWDALWNEEWKGNITMLNNMRACFGAALQRMGYPVNSTKKSQIDEAKEMLIQQKDLLKTYTNTTFELLAKGNASPCYAWSGDVRRGRFQAMENGKSPVHYFLPEEGGMIWVDNGAIPKGARHPNAAYAFMVYYLTPKLGGELSNFTSYNTPNEAAKKHIRPQLAKELEYPEEKLKKVVYWREVTEVLDYYNKAWNEVKQA